MDAQRRYGSSLHGAPVGSKCRDSPWAHSRSSLTIKTSAIKDFVSGAKQSRVYSARNTPSDDLQGRQTASRRTMHIAISCLTASYITNHYRHNRCYREYYCSCAPLHSPCRDALLLDHPRRLPKEGKLPVTDSMRSGTMSKSFTFS